MAGSGTTEQDMIDSEEQSMVKKLKSLLIARQPTQTMVLRIAVGSLTLLLGEGSPRRRNRQSPRPPSRVCKVGLI